MRRSAKLSRGGLYRSRNGVILGVCRGIAEYFDFSVIWTRIIAVILFFFSGLWPAAIIYLIAALLMKPEPVITIETPDEQEFYDSYISSKHGASQRLRRRFENLQRRIQRLEHIVTTREFNWEDRLNK